MQAIVNADVVLYVEGALSIFTGAVAEPTKSFVPMFGNGNQWQEQPDDWIRYPPRVGAASAQ
jgi:hypothetical protein